MSFLDPELNSQLKLLRSEFVNSRPKDTRLNSHYYCLKEEKLKDYMEKNFNSGGNTMKLNDFELLTLDKGMPKTGFKSSLFKSAKKSGGYVFKRENDEFFEGGAKKRKAY